MDIELKTVVCCICGVVQGVNKNVESKKCCEGRECGCFGFEITKNPCHECYVNKNIRQQKAEW